MRSMMRPPSKAFRARRSGCQAIMPSASPASMRSSISLNKGRPLFNEMLDRIEAGDADGIIAWHPDRLARNAFDGGRIIDLIDQGLLKDLRFCTFWFEASAQGKLMLN